MASPDPSGDIAAIERIDRNASRVLHALIRDTKSEFLSVDMRRNVDLAYKYAEAMEARRAEFQSRTTSLRQQMWKEASVSLTLSDEAD